MFYDYQKVLSYNAFLNFIIGERGVGKTYGALKFCVNDYLKNGNQFIYLRRYKTEISSSVTDLFSKISSNEEFPETELTSSFRKNKGLLKCNGEVMGYSIPLSTSVVLKSTNFDKVKTIIFDEFIIDKGNYHYLQNEVHQFLEFVETVARLRDVRVLLLGNAVQKANPYFNYFKLDIPYKTDVKTYKNGLILVNYIANYEYRAYKKATKFGRLTDGTEYGLYAIDNKFLRENKTFIAKRPPQSKFYFILRINHENVGVWTGVKDGRIYLSSNYDPKCPILYATSIKDHDENTKLLQVRNSTFMKTLIERYRDGELFFESQKIKQLCLDVLNKYVN